MSYELVDFGVPMVDFGVPMVDFGVPFGRFWGTEPSGVAVIGAIIFYIFFIIFYFV